MPVICDSKTSKIDLEGMVDIGCAAELKSALLDTLKNRGEVRIALSGVRGIDLTAVQLLLAAERETAALGGTWMLDGFWPESEANMLRDAGFARLPFEADVRQQVR